MVTKPELIDHYESLLAELKGEGPAFHDTFAEVLDADITVHAPDVDVVGGGWTGSTPVITVIGGGGYATLIGNGARCLANCGKVNFSATLTGKPVSESGKQQIILALVDQDNFVQCSLNTANHEAELWQRIGGTWTMLANAPTDHVGTDRFTMTGAKSGNYYSVSVNGVEVIPGVEIVSLIPIPGLVGLRSNTTEAHQYDDFLVQ